MSDIIIADTSCLIILDNISELDLLNMIYGTIIVTPEIAAEFGKQLPGWVSVRSPQNLQLQTSLELRIDKGEASAISLAMEMQDCLIILDDLQARSLAIALKLVVTGTVGTIVQAKKMGIISSVKPLLNKIKQTNFRLALAVELLAIKQAGE